MQLYGRARVGAIEVLRMDYFKGRVHP